MSRLCQGFHLLLKAAKKFGWKINIGECARIWRSGCIIRSKLLDKLVKIYQSNPSLELLLLDPSISSEINSKQESIRRIVTLSIASGYTMPSLASSLIYYDNIRRARLPHNLLQAQRDFFGSHQFERVDKPKGEFFHCRWTPDHA